MDRVKYIKAQLSDRFIKNNALVVGEMQRQYKEHGRPDHAAKRAGLTIRLFAEYAILKKKPLRVKQKRARRLTWPESCEKRQITERELSERIAEADVIVFDVWNILVYSALDSRQLLALFETVTGVCGVSEYLESDALTEEDQRSCLEEISMDFCLDNKYMHHIWDRAKAMGKSVYLYNNAEYSDAFIGKIADKFAYAGEIYHGDIRKALYITADSGIKTGINYRNVNELGERYRPFYCKNIVTAFYNQIVNLRFHAERTDTNSFFYEYGFACGGILTCGFCQYLNELVEDKKIEKLLFVARDGNIIKKVYDRYYKKCDTAYLRFSRFASYEIIFEDFPEEYIEKNIKTRMRSGKHTIGGILQECGLGCLEKQTVEQGLSPAEDLNDNNYTRFKQFLLHYKDRIAEEFHDASLAARQYFLQEIEGYGSVCVVDLGWRGTSAVYLKHLFHKYGWKGHVMGALIGAALDDVTQTYVRDGMLHTYAFDNTFYRRTGADNGEYMLQEELFCIESLFSAEEPTLLRYKLNADGETGFIYEPQNPNREMTAEIQKGIMDYAETCAPLLSKYHLQILSRDAYMPLDFCMQNRKYRKLIGQGYSEVKDALAGFEPSRGN